jgi:hypothetical protein
MTVIIGREEDMAFLFYEEKTAGKRLSPRRRDGEHGKAISLPLKRLCIFK